jgi:hypothetical protein
MKNSVTILLDRCFECGTIGDVDFHHVVPKSKGGTQMIPLCLSCHSKVHGEHMLKIRKLANDSRNRMIKEKKEKGIPHNLGRKEGYRETMDTFINKPKTKEIINLLSLNHTLREISKMIQCSTKTVQKVKNIVNQLSTPHP